MVKRKDPEANGKALVLTFHQGLHPNTRPWTLNSDQIKKIKIRGHSQPKFPFEGWPGEASAAV